MGPHLHEVPIFLDVHKVPFSEEHLKELNDSPRTNSELPM